MVPRIRIERRIIAVRVVDLAPGLTVDASLVEDLCEVDGRIDVILIHDDGLRERLLAGGWITVRAVNCFATDLLRVAARELDLG